MMGRGKEEQRVEEEGSVGEEVVRRRPLGRREKEDVRTRNI